MFIITSPRPRGVQNFRFVVLKKKDNINKDDDSGILSFLSGLLENFFLPVFYSILTFFSMFLIVKQSVVL